jgi:hypothetical protein
MLMLENQRSEDNLGKFYFFRKSNQYSLLGFLTGQVDKRTLEKYHIEARKKSRESWYLS